MIADCPADIVYAIRKYFSIKSIISFSLMNLVFKFTCAIFFYSVCMLLNFFSNLIVQLFDVKKAIDIYRLAQMFLTIFPKDCGIR